MKETKEQKGTRGITLVALVITIIILLILAGITISSLTNTGLFEKAQEVNSNTQLYKQAGNSIVKNVLVAIFGQMIDGKENVYKEVV